MIAEATNAASLSIPVFDDSSGTAFINNGSGVKKAISWSPTGFDVYENGSPVSYGKWPLDVPTCPQTGGGTTYYISESKGDNGNDGLSMSTPKADKTFINGTVVAGDTVLWRRGDTWGPAQFFPNISGTATDYIKFGAYQDVDGTDDPKPIFDGEDTQAYLIYTGSSNNYLWFEDLDIMRGNGNSPTGNIGMVYSNGDYNIFKNCVIRESNGAGADITGVGSALYGCEILDNNFQGVKATRATTGVPSNRVVANCTFMRNCAGGDPSSPSGAEPLTLLDSNALVYGNVFEDNRTDDHLAYRTWINSENDTYVGEARLFNNTFDCSAGNGYSFGPMGMKGRGGRTYRNRILTATMRGLEFQLPAAADGGTPYGIAYHHHNVVVDVNPYGGDPEGIGVALTALTFADANGEGDLKVYNTTFDSCTEGFQIDATAMAGISASGFECVGNLFSNMATRLGRIDYTTGLTISIDYNYYDDASGTPFKHTTTDTSLADWRSTHGFDINGVDGGDPLYTLGTGPISSRDYSLTSSSPARSLNGTYTGTDDVPLVDTDPNAWIGINYVPHATNPDAGAYQYLTGKTLDFSKYFLGNIQGGGSITECQIYDRTFSTAELATLTT